MDAAIPPERLTEGMVAEMSQLATEQPPEVVEPVPLDIANGTWYLGIDLGTTKIAAALFHVQTTALYPIVWGEPGQREQQQPAIALLTDDQLSQPPHPPTMVGDRALQATLNQPPLAQALLLNHFKLCLNLALPYVSTQTQTREPILQWSDHQALPLAWLPQTLVALLQPLTVHHSETLTACSAQKLPSETFSHILTQLAGVVVGCPNGWSDAYRLNVREAVLTLGLVNHAAQIFFVEEAIATLLAELPTTHRAGNPPTVSQWTTPVTPTQSTSTQSASTQTSATLQGSILVIDAGATTTELLLLDLLTNPQMLHYEDLNQRSIDYAGDAIDQDIITQVLLPSAWGWEEMNLQSLDLPLPGEPDRPTRDRLQQRLRSSALGLGLLDAASRLKLALHQSDSATFSLNDQQWMVNQQELHSRVVLPYIQRLNWELNTLLSQTGTAMEAIQWVISTGGTAAMPAIAYWLRQKLPNARFIQHTDAADFSRVALGLAKLPLYPQVLNPIRHQYSDYFLLHEILKMPTDQPLPLGRIFQLLENQGINTQACQRTILHLLEGQLPAGLVPAKADANLLTPASRQSHDYQAIAAPLCSREGNQSYRFNPVVRDRLRQYLSAVLAEAHQAIDEPLTVNLAVVSGS